MQGFPYIHTSIRKQIQNYIACKKELNYSIGGFLLRRGQCQSLSNAVYDQAPGGLFVKNDILGWGVIRRGTYQIFAEKHQWLFR